MNEIFTIGYGGRKTGEFIALLKQYKIEFLVDIRSKPYSRYNTDFSQANLSRILAQTDIRYVFMGDLLGGRPDDPDCYTDEGKVDYEKCEEKDFYQTGISRLKKALSLDLHVVLMCSEQKPQDCHRSKLVGETLTKQGISVFHIDEQGKLKSHTIVIETIMSSLKSPFPAQLHLFEPQPQKKLKLTSRKSYQQDKDKLGD